MCREVLIDEIRNEYKGEKVLIIEHVNPANIRSNRNIIHDFDSMFDNLTMKKTISSFDCSPNQKLYGDIMIDIEYADVVICVKRGDKSELDNDILFKVIKQRKHPDTDAKFKIGQCYKLKCD